MAFNRSSQRQNVAIILSSMSFLLWGVKWVFPLNLEEEAHGFNKWQLGFGSNIVHDGSRHEGSTTGIDEYFAFAQTTITVATFEQKVVGCHPVGGGAVECFPANLHVEHPTAGWFSRVIRQS